MDLYTDTSYKISEKITKQYSTSFSSSSKLFEQSIRKYIYAIYGLVRIADEVVDTYRGDKKLEKLDELEKSIYEATKSGFSTNPIVHAFSDTANRFDITKEIIRPFFDSMAMDVKPRPLNRKEYEKYIYGSAEVVGLMCLKVFVGVGNNKHYEDLSFGAKKLGSAYQKVNFLRDISMDFKELGRSYFPDISFEEFDDIKKQEIISEIREDFLASKDYIDRLPDNSKLAVLTSYQYYSQLLKKIESTPAQDIKEKRIRVSNPKKLQLMITTYLMLRLKI